jgi:NAD(P)H-dependent flavin oxidoreductase YrpB (nitropropane dioxygenase family)
MSSLTLRELLVERWVTSLRHELLLDRLAVPIVLAPLAGGPSTPELTAAVSNAGGFGFLAAGYLGASALAERLERTRTLTGAPIGVNLFIPGTSAPPQAVDAYAARLADDARQAGVELGAARFDDDDWAAKLELLMATPVAVVSFVFGCPEPEVIDRFTTPAARSGSPSLVPTRPAMPSTPGRMRWWSRGQRRAATGPASATTRPRT